MFPYFATTKLLSSITKFSTISPSNLFHTAQIHHKKNKNSTKECPPKKIAMILCGCGVLDGTEVSEAVSAMIHLSQKGFETHFFAPDISICAPINHLTKDVENVNRNAMVEAARITRGNLKLLCQCRVCKYSALVIPGGLGVGRTLSDFASKGANCVILPELIRILNDFNCDSRPIGGICSAAGILPKVFEGVTVTLGKDSPKDRYIYSDAIDKVKEMGATVDMQDSKGVTHCKKYNVFTTPAFMDSHASHADVHEGIGKMISMMCKFMK